MDLAAAYKMVYEDLWNNGKPIYQGKFDPNENEEAYVDGIKYLLFQIGIKAYGKDLTVVPKRFATATANVVKSCTNNGIFPRSKLDENYRDLLIRRLRTSDDKVLNFFADEYEKNRVLVKMCSQDTMGEIATGKQSYPITDEYTGEEE